MPLFAVGALTHGAATVYALHQTGQRMNHSCSIFSGAQRHQLLHRVEGLGINDGLVSSFDSEPLFPRHGDESLGLITHLFRPPLHHVANVHLVM